MSTALSRLWRALPAALLLFSVASTVAACADIHPSTEARSPNFHG